MDCHGLPGLAPTLGNVINRNPEAFANDTYDLVVVGGGIYGACLSLEAARRGLKPLLLERDDFGGATSWNSLRILHGGLRYLQNLDLSRFRESVSERHWFSKHFPELVRPLPCMMPLYGRGLKRKEAFGPALKLNDWLSSHRNDGVAESVRLPNGRLLNVEQTKGEFALVDPAGLQGSGYWYDARMINSQRLLIEVLRWACGLGARALNYVEATELLVESGQVSGVRGEDKVAGRTREFRAPYVINCAGPWSQEVASRFDREIPNLFHASLAFNVFIDREPLSSSALAVQPRRKGSQVFFMYPAGGGILLGTIHAPWTTEVTSPDVPEAHIRSLIDDVNHAIPGFNLEREQIIRILSGFLPAAQAGSDAISRRPAVHVHARHGGPRGLLSLCGVKFTTARLVGEQALGEVNPAWKKLSYIADSDRPAFNDRGLDLGDPAAVLGESTDAMREVLVNLIREEGVVTMDDLLYRRTDWGLDARRAPEVAARISELAGDAFPGGSDRSVCHTKKS